MHILREGVPGGILESGHKILFGKKNIIRN